jgi:transcriptional regulator with XRE-family HTH domain
MEKSIYSREYQVMLRLLREARSDAGLTQLDLAKRLRLTQSLVSKIERGDRRLDLAELRSFCRVIGIGLVEFVGRVERELAKRS